MIDWGAILEGTSAGIAAALLLGILAFSRDRIRDVILKWRIRQSFQCVSIGSGIYGATLTISNHLRRGFRIREISVVTSEMRIRLNPTGKVETSFDGQRPKLTKEQKKVLKRDGKVGESAELKFAPWKASKSPEGFAEVEPFTSQEFILPIGLIQYIDAPISGIQFIV